MKKVGLHDILIYIIILCIFVGLISLFARSAPVDDTYTYPEIRQLFLDGQVKTFHFEGNTLYMELRKPYDGQTDLSYNVYSFELFYDEMDDLVQQQYADGIILDYDYPSAPATSSGWWSAVSPYVLLVVVIVFVLLLTSRRGVMGGNNLNNQASRFGKAHVYQPGEGDAKVTFDDVAGADEEKAELQEIVEFLRNPDHFTALGARIPKGVLLLGPPGVGKTLLAKAVAGEAKVNFLPISGSDFVELYVGVGASRVRDLFTQAKSSAPAIVFIDEIDAVGRQRGTGLGGGHDEREQTLNQLLVEMDGFAANSSVVVMAATNRPDILDPALLRPGRFDRQITVGLPDIKGREEILRVHVRKKPLAEDVDLSSLAKSTAGFSGADLENLTNEAALLAAREGRTFITNEDFEAATIKVIAGPEKKSRVMSAHTLRVTAYHEAGHAVVIRHLPTHDPVHQISIIPRGQAAGMTISLPQEDKPYLSRTEMFEQIISLMGGRVAEQMVIGDISTGASNDIERASKLARKMVTAYGMSDRLGPISFESSSDEVFIGRSMGHTRSYSEEVASLIDEEVKGIIDTAYARCRNILEQHFDKLTAVAEFLLKNETMSAEEFEALFAGEAEQAEEPALPEPLLKLPPDHVPLTPNAVDPGCSYTGGPDDGKPPEKK